MLDLSDDIRKSAMWYPSSLRWCALEVDAHSDGGWDYRVLHNFWDSRARKKRVPERFAPNIAGPPCVTHMWWSRSALFVISVVSPWDGRSGCPHTIGVEEVLVNFVKGDCKVPLNENLDGDLVWLLKYLTSTPGALEATDFQNWAFWINGKLVRPVRVRRSTTNR